VYFGRVDYRNIAGSNSWSTSEFEFTTTYKIPEVAAVGMVCLVINQKANVVGFDSPHHANNIKPAKMKISFLNESSGRYSTLDVVKVEGDKVFVDQGMNSFTTSLMALKKDTKTKVDHPEAGRQFPLVKLHGFKKAGL
jgi:hypothetical protein